jgi:pyruvate dehydrogenase E2 component (dihydrolipoamide acetyltransferase)
VAVGKVIALIAKPDEVIAAPQRGAEEPPAAQPTQDAPTAPPAPPSQSTTSASSSSAPVTPVAARMAAEHGIDVSRIQPTGGRIQKEDVLAYLASQRPTGGRVPASPKARRLAEEAGIDLSSLMGSGPEGAVIAADVLAAQTTEARSVARPVAPSVGEPELVPMSRMWKVMAERLAQSWTSVPHFFLARDVDAKRFKKWYRNAQERSESKLTYTDLLVLLVAHSLRAHRRVNAAWIDGRIVANEGVHIGLAVAVEEGLLVPVIRDADKLGLEGIAAGRADLVARAQAGRLSVDELQGGTFTISNLGMFGIDQFSAIINPPQAAILAVGRIADRVVAVDGKAKVRPMLTLNLSCDHRVVDGARAARFLDHLAGLIEEPMRLLE